MPTRVGAERGESFRAYSRRDRHTDGRTRGRCFTFTAGRGLRNNFSDTAQYDGL